MKVHLLPLIGFLFTYMGAIRASDVWYSEETISLSGIPQKFLMSSFHGYYGRQHITGITSDNSTFATQDMFDNTFSVSHLGREVRPDLMNPWIVLAAPTITTSSATSLTATTATLNGIGNPNGDATTGWFRYSTVNPGTGNDSFGTRAPASGGASLGSGISPVPYSEPITGLMAGTTYYYCAIGSNALGTSFGAIQSFTTSPPPTAPTITTNSATSLVGTSATLNGSGDPNGDATTAWFRYSTVSPGTPNDVFGIRVPASGGTSLGSETSPVPYSEPITGLTAGITYYYSAIGSNAVGTSFGSLQTFVIPTAPSATTNAASAITGTSATLNGSGTPNGASTTAWYRYSTTNPGTGDDVTGTRAPSSGGNSLGSGTSPVPYMQAITGLIPATTYYYWTVVSNSEGISFGSVLSFTTFALAPTVTTNSATSITTTTATLNGSGNPNGDATTGWFRYSTVNPGTGNDSFGTRAPASGGTSLGSGLSSVPYSEPITGLTAGTTYYYCAIGSNAVGTSFGAIQSFTTSPPPTAPTITTNSATSLVGTSATLNGSGDPNGDPTTGWFRYSTINPGTGNDSFGTRTPASGGSSLGSGTSPVPYSEAITGLIPATTYYYCAIGSNAVGTSFGSIQTFVIPTAPTATTNAATAITGTSATLNGIGTPNGASATAWYRYSTTNPGTGDDITGTRAPVSGGTSLGAGTSPVPYLQAIAGLLPATTYYYWAIVSTSEGISFGSVLSFTTFALAPTVTTNSATSITTTTATLNGSGNPNGDATTGWFRYSTVNPGTGNDSFGTRAPASGGASLGSGISSVPYSEPITGLTAGTTYYYCAIGSNALGTSFGAIQSFTTSPPPTAPTITTNSATSLVGTSATLNGSGDPNGDPTTGWFRYSTVSPGTPNDAFGIRVPASGGTSLGSGTSPVPYSEPITGLTAGITYYYSAIGSNGVGTSFGSLQTFVIPTAPLENGNVGIGTTTPNASAQLDVTSTTKGFLPPRMTASQRDAITSPVNGLVIYCTDCGGGEIEVYNTFGWTNMLGNAPAGSLSIGDTYGGGKIAYILQTGDPGYVVGQIHGLIAATTDHNTGVLWGCGGTAIPGADGTSVGTGNQNTIDIMAGCATAGIAAKICGDLVLNGYSDWYLPSKDELNKLYINRVAIGGFITSGYWSSSEVDNVNVWFQNFFNGTQESLSKGAPNFVRSVRAF